MFIARRPSLLPKPNKQNSTPLIESRLKQPHVRHHRSESCINLRSVEIVQVENFLDDSLIDALHFEISPYKVPIIEEMPSVDLRSVGSGILTPRDFQQFTRDAKLSADKIQRLFAMRRYVKCRRIDRALPPEIDWNQHRRRYETQAVRQNCSNAEYVRLFKEGKTRIKDFTDESFRFLQSSLTAKPKSSETKNPPVRQWKRLVLSQSDPFPCEQITQGTFRTEHLLSCFMALPPVAQLYLFQDQQFCQNSAFFVRLHKQGIWRYILIDNLLPYAEDSISLLSEGFALTLLEKAWAKYEGSYSSLDQIEHIKISEVIGDLTGAPSEEYKCNHPRLLFIMSIMLKRKYVVLANSQASSSKRKKIEDKLMIPPDYAYPVERIEGECVILRNQWGAQKKSPFFDRPEIKLHITEFKQFFQSIVVSKIVIGGWHNSVSVLQKRDQYSLVRVIPQGQCTGFFTLTQIHKLQPEEWYSDCRLVLFEMASGKPVFIQEQDSAEKKTIMEVELCKSVEYLLLIQMGWTTKNHETVLSTLTTSQLRLAKQRFSPDNDYLLTLKKPRARERQKQDQTTAHKTNPSD